VTNSRTRVLTAVVVAATLCACDGRSPPPDASPSPAPSPPARDDAVAGVTPPVESMPPTRPFDAAVSALAWMRRRQSADGSWGDPATTGIALLAFLGYGETHQIGSSRETVKNALKHLRDIQDADGRLVGPDSPRRLRDHAVAGLALTEAFGMTGSLVFKEPAQRAVAFAMRNRTPGGGWGRSIGDGEFDFETTVWTAMLVKSAKLAELDVEASVLDDAVRAIDLVTDRSTGRVTAAGGSPSVEAATAMGMLVRFLAGRDPDGDELFRRGGDWLSKHPPSLGPRGPADAAAWYFGSHAMFEMDDALRWPWLRALMRGFHSSQVADGDERGSWNPPGDSSSVSDRVWTTAFTLLAAAPELCNWYPYRLKRAK